MARLSAIDDMSPELSPVFEGSENSPARELPPLVVPQPTDITSTITPSSMSAQNLAQQLSPSPARVLDTPGLDPSPHHSSSPAISQPPDLIDPFSSQDTSFQPSPDIITAAENTQVSLIENPVTETDTEGVTTEIRECSLSDEDDKEEENISAGLQIANLIPPQLEENGENIGNSVPETENTSQVLRPESAFQSAPTQPLLGGVHKRSILPRQQQVLDGVGCSNAANFCCSNSSKLEKGNGKVGEDEDKDSETDQQPPIQPLAASSNSTPPITAAAKRRRKAEEKENIKASPPSYEKCPQNTLRDPSFSLSEESSEFPYNPALFGRPGESSSTPIHDPFEGNVNNSPHVDCFGDPIPGPANGMEDSPTPQTKEHGQPAEGNSNGPQSLEQTRTAQLSARKVSIDPQAFSQLPCNQYLPRAKAKEMGYSQYLGSSWGVNDLINQEGCFFSRFLDSNQNLHIAESPRFSYNICKRRYPSRQLHSDYTEFRKQVREGVRHQIELMEVELGILDSPIKQKIRDNDGEVGFFDQLTIGEEERTTMEKSIESMISGANQLLGDVGGLCETLFEKIRFEISCVKWCEKTEEKFGEGRHEYCRQILEMKDVYVELEEMELDIRNEFNARKGAFESWKFTQRLNVLRAAIEDWDKIKFLLFQQFLEYSGQSGNRTSWGMLKRKAHCKLHRLDWPYDKKGMKKDGSDELARLKNKYGKRMFEMERGSLDEGKVLVGAMVGFGVSPSEVAALEEASSRGSRGSGDGEVLDALGGVVLGESATSPQREEPPVSGGVVTASQFLKYTEGIEKQGNGDVQDEPPVAKGTKVPEDQDTTQAKESSPVSEETHTSPSTKRNDSSSIGESPPPAAIKTSNESSKTALNATSPPAKNSNHSSQTAINNPATNTSNNKPRTPKAGIKLLVKASPRNERIPLVGKIKKGAKNMGVSVREFFSQIEFGSEFHAMASAASVGVSMYENGTV